MGVGLGMCGVYGNTLLSSQLRRQPKTALKTVYLKGEKKKKVFTCVNIFLILQKTVTKQLNTYLLDRILGHELFFVFLIFLSLRILFL